MTSHEVLRRLLAEGWFEVGQKGSHKHYPPLQARTRDGPPSKARYSGWDTAFNMATGRLDLATQVNRKRESVGMQIVALVHRDNESYGISFPDLPGCISAATSLDELLLDGKEALDLHVEMMLQDGEALPDFRSLHALRADPEFAEDFATAELVTLLPVDIPGRAVKVTITMEEHLLMRLNKAAERQGYTRSGFIAEAVRRKLAG